jgi:hypothetical protein
MSARETLLVEAQRAHMQRDPMHNPQASALDAWLADPECRDALVDLLIDAGALDEIGSIECPGCRGDCVVAYGTEDETLCSTCDGRGSVRALRRVSGGTG